MCELITIATATAGVLSAVSGIYSAKSQKAAAEYQADLTVQQAEKAEKDAAYERQTGIEEARNQRLQAILDMGDEKAAFAAGNIAVSSQTALNAVDDARLNGELEALTTLRESERTADNYIFQAEQLYANAGLTSFNAKQNYISSSINALSSSIGTSTNIYNDYQKRKGSKCGF